MSNNPESNLQGEKYKNIRVQFSIDDSLTYSNIRSKEPSKSSDDQKLGFIQKKETSRRKYQQIWSSQEDLKLVLFLKEQGATWKSISPKLTGKSEIEIKKHYLKIIRHTITHINSIIRNTMNIQINCKQIYAIVNYLCQGRDFKNQHQDQSDSKCREILSQLLLEHLNRQIKENQIYCNGVVESIKGMILLFKKMQKTKHINKAKTAVSSFASEKEEVANERGYLSDSSSIYEDPFGPSQHNPSLQRDYESDREKQNQQQPPQEVERRIKGPVIVAQEESQIKAILLEAGLLHFEVSPINESLQDPFMPNSNWQMKAEDLENDTFCCLTDDLHHFYQQNELDQNCYWKVNFGNQRESI